MTAGYQLEARFCPKCASPSVEYSMLEGGDARCTACDWKGSKANLLVSPVVQGEGLSEELIAKFERDVRLGLARELAALMGLILKQWGFLYGNEREMATLLGRYMKRAGRALVEAIIDERRIIEQERVKRMEAANGTDPR